MFVSFGASWISLLYYYYCYQHLLITFLNVNAIPNNFEKTGKCNSVQMMRCKKYRKL